MSNRVTQQDLVDQIAHEAGTSKRAARRFLKAFGDVIGDGLDRDGTVHLRGFGTFRLRRVMARRGRNPQTGESMLIPAQRKVILQPGKSLRELVNRPFSMLKTRLLPASPPSTSPEPDSDSPPSTKLPARPAIVEFEAIPEAVLTDPGDAGPELPTSLPRRVPPQAAPVRSEPPAAKRRFWPLLLLLALAILVVVRLPWPSDTGNHVADRSGPGGVDSVGREQPLPGAPPLDWPQNGQPQLPAAQQHRVQPGESLWSLAAQNWQNPFYWPLLYAANVETLGDPDELDTGISLQVPALSPPAHIDSTRLAQAHLQVYFAYKAYGKPRALAFLRAAWQLDSTRVLGQREQIATADLVQARQ